MIATREAYTLVKVGEAPCACMIALAKTPLKIKYVFSIYTESYIL